MITLQSVEQKLSKLSEIMNTNQKQIYNVFVNLFQSIHHQIQITPTSFRDTERTNRLPLNNWPPVMTLLHGAAGTGKSTCTKTIIKAADLLGVHTSHTGFNAINAIHIDGETTAAHLHLKSTHKDLLEEITDPLIRELKEKYKGVCLIIIDEVSTQAPWHLAWLNYTVQAAVSNTWEPFGGMPMLLVGDFGQLKPVLAGLSLLASVLQLAAHIISQQLVHDDSMGTATAFPSDANLSWEKEGSTEEDMLAIQWQHEEDDMLAIQWQHEGLIVDDDQQQHRDTENIVNSGNDAANTAQWTTSQDWIHKQNHPILMGAKLLMMVQWFELTEQV